MLEFFAGWMVQYRGRWVSVGMVEGFWCVEKVAPEDAVMSDCQEFVRVYVSVEGDAQSSWSLAPPNIDKAQVTERLNKERARWGDVLFMFGGWLILRNNGSDEASLDVYNLDGTIAETSCHQSRVQAPGNFPPFRIHVVLLAAAPDRVNDLIAGIECPEFDLVVMIDSQELTVRTQGDLPRGL